MTKVLSCPNDSGNTMLDDYHWDRPTVISVSTSVFPPGCRWGSSMHLRLFQDSFSRTRSSLSATCWSCDAWGRPSSVGRCAARSSSWLSWSCLVYSGCRTTSSTWYRSVFLWWKVSFPQCLSFFLFWQEYFKSKIWSLTKRVLFVWRWQLSGTLRTHRLGISKY